jgi:hypothetical protein
MERRVRKRGTGGEQRRLWGRWRGEEKRDEGRGCCGKELRERLDKK